MEYVVTMFKKKRNFMMKMIWGVLVLSLTTLAPTVETALAEGKPRVAVVEFEAKVPKAKREMGTAMSDLLIDALVKTKRYSVLERSVIDKIRQEQDMTLSGEVDAATGAAFGRLIGAEFLVVGAVTKFEEKGGGGVGGLLSRKVVGGAGMKTSEVGMTLRIIQSTTGEILASEKVSQKARAIGLAAGGVIGGIPLGGGLYKTKAMQTAIDKAIQKAVVLIGDKLPEPDPNAPDVSAIEVELTGVDFKMLKTFTRTIKGLEGVHDVSRTFSDGVATFGVNYEGSADQLAEEIDEAKPDGVDLEVTGFSDRRIEMTVK